jgi:hypothetical protein
MTVRRTPLTRLSRRVPSLLGLVLAAVLLAGCVEALASVPARLEAPAETAPRAADLLPTLTPKPGGTPPALAGAEPETPAGAPVVAIPLAGPPAQRNAELSGLAWYRETLILLPQYPTFTQDGQSAVWALPKAEILAFLDGETPGPLTPRPLTWYDWGVAAALPGFEGY